MRTLLILLVLLLAGCKTPRTTTTTRVFPSYDRYRTLPPYSYCNLCGRYHSHYCAPYYRYYNYPKYKPQQPKSKTYYGPRTNRSGGTTIPKTRTAPSKSSTTPKRETRTIKR